MILHFLCSSSKAICKPRASGDDPIVVTWLGVITAVNPARAGMILIASATLSPTGCKPRASGDDPALRRRRRKRMR